MATERIFLGWDRPLATLAAEWLLDRAAGRPADFSGTLVVVPTRQAGRRLRSRLAELAKDRCGGAAGLQVTTPSWLARQYQPDLPEADALTMLACWIDVLSNEDLAGYPDFFPNLQKGKPSVDWLTGAAGMVQRIRSRLAEGVHTVQSLAEQLPEAIQEPERWRDLAKLEQRYLEALRQKGFSDPFESQVAFARRPALEGDIQALVFAGVPDPSTLVVKMLEQLSVSMPVTFLIHAPEEHEALFDRTGRPAESWLNEDIAIPEVSANLFSEANPDAQARRVLEIIKEEAASHGPSDFAVGVPDPEVIAPLQEALLKEGVTTFDPSPCPVKDHALGRLVVAAGRLALKQDYEALRELVRHPSMLDWLSLELKAGSSLLLSSLDLMQNRHLPLDLDLFEELLLRVPDVEYPRDTTCRELAAKAVRCVRRVVQPLRTEGAAEGLRQFMLDVFQGRSFIHERAEDETFLAVAEVLAKLLDELERSLVVFTDLGLEQQLSLLAARLSQQQYSPAAVHAAMDLDGWLELPWNDAEVLIVTGMNEGAVPDTVTGDPLLPEAVCRELDLYTDEKRLARDAFLMRSMIESRAGKGRSVFMCGRKGHGGDPSRPSRLLMRVADNDLPDRMKLLFEEPPLLEVPPAREERLRLNLLQPLSAKGAWHMADRVSVTDFKVWLGDHFHYFLARGLDMEEQDDLVREPGGAPFGEMIHHAWNCFALDKEAADSADPFSIFAVLEREAAQWCEARFGPRARWPLTVTLAHEAGCERLREGAAHQAACRKEGWVIRSSEEKYQQTMEFEGGRVVISGKIDRVDCHEETGRWRIIDYKSSDKPETPLSAHLKLIKRGEPDPLAACITGDIPAQWLDLQLPLYVFLTRSRLGAELPELAYFNLPKTLEGTGLSVWDDYSNEMQASAEACAKRVLACLKRGQFWFEDANLRRGRNYLEEFTGRNIEETFSAESLEALVRGVGS